MPTYGNSGQPLQSTFNYDALVATSLANYRKTLTDNISTTNLVFSLLKEKGMWESADGGLYIAEDLMTGLAPVDSYDGYDELPLTPTEGITQAQFQWRQLAAPIAISEKERKQNKHRLVDLVAAKLQQADIAMQEKWAKHFLWGSLAGAGTTLVTPYISPVNGSQSFDPIGTMIADDPTASLEIGGINQSTAVSDGTYWWRNITKDAAATTMTGFIQEILNVKNSCSRGPGGIPNAILTDQTTWELLSVAYYLKYQTQAKEVGDYPFPVLNFHGTLVGWDQYVPDSFTNVTSTATYGTMYFLNTKFMKVRYESETNFVSTEFQKPINQDAKYKHILWMGNITTNNRRKLGVYAKIPRTLTAS